MTRQVSYVHTYFIGLMCGLFGLAATVLASDLLIPDRSRWTRAQRVAVTTHCRPTA